MLVIQDLRVEDPVVCLTAADAVRRSPGSLDAWVAATLGVGARASELASTSIDRETLRVSLDTFTTGVLAAAASATEEVRDTVTRLLSPDGEGVAAVVQKALSDLAGDIGKLVAGPEAPVPAAVHSVVERSTAAVLAEVQRAVQAQSELVRSVLASDNPGSPLHALRSEVLRNVSETRQELGRELADVKAMVSAASAHRGAMKLTAIKGFSYEDAVAGLMESIAVAAGDAFEATGATPGLMSRSKCGDGVVTFASAHTRGRNVKLVIEAKDRSLSGAQWRQELANARANRGTHCALGLVRSAERMPGGKHIYMIDPLHAVVVWDPESDPDALVVALYGLLKALAISSHADIESRADGPKLRELLRDALSAIDDFERIKRQTQIVKKAAADAALVADELRSKLLTQVRASLAIIEADQASSEEPKSSLRGLVS